jgi:serine-type D-Ala-D-Ala carboxypeptidase/endopeptidase (penicillin-binding protein 4)
MPRSSPARVPGRLGVVALVLVSLSVGALVWTTRADAGRGDEPEPVLDATPTAALTTPVLSARRAPELLRSHIADTRIREALAPLLADAPADSCIVVTNGGRAVIARNPDRPMVPASTEKLLIGAVLLEALGEDRRLTTVVGAASTPRDGVVEGDLYLIGGGDPLLTTPGYQVTFENPDQLVNQFAQLADRVVAAGVREVRGGIVGDESRYDTERWIPTWPDRYQREGYVGPMSALIVNDGNTGLSQLPDEPASTRRAGEPALLAAETLAALLEARGVTVSGDPSQGDAPGSVVELATLDSLPMRDLVFEMIADSDNTTAELLVKELGLVKTGEGTTSAGLAAITEGLEATDLDTEGLALLDGSGLDPQNRLSCSLLVAALDLHGPSSVLGESLPVAGETGTLRRRMRGTPAAGKVRAKTGTLAEVNALAGYAETSGGAQLTFAYIINGPEPRGYLPIDEFAAALVGVPDGPEVARLEPAATGS